MLHKKWIEEDVYDEEAVMKLKKRTIYFRSDVIHSTILVLRKLKQAYIFAQAGRHDTQ